MKIALVFLALMLASSSGFCQEYKLVKMGNQRFLEFTLTDLIRLFNMSELVWETEMNNNGFEKLDESEGITIYISGEIGQQSLAVSRNIVGYFLSTGLTTLERKGCLVLFIAYSRVITSRPFLGLIITRTISI